MTKQAWIKHIEEERHIILADTPIELWREEVKNHLRQNPNCPICKARRKTKIANCNRKAREQVMRDCGLIKVKGALGGTYWE